MSGGVLFYTEPLSTRERCKLSTWDQKLEQVKAAKQQQKSQQKAKATVTPSVAHKNSAPAAAAKPKPKPQVDFSCLDDDTPEPPPKPKPVSTAKLATSKVTKPSQPRVGGPSKQVPQQARPSRPPPSKVTGVVPKPSLPQTARIARAPQQRTPASVPATANPVRRIISPGSKSKKGAGAKHLAVPVNANGISKKNVASKALQDSVTRLKAENSKLKPTLAAPTITAGQIQRSNAVRPNVPLRPSAALPRNGTTSAVSTGKVVRPAKPGVIGRKPIVKRKYDEEEEDDDDDEGGFDWRSELKAVTGYDPSKFRDHHFDDRKMEASASDIWKEEKRSERLGRLADKQEEMLEEQRRREKLMKKKKMRVD